MTEAERALHALRAMSSTFRLHPISRTSIEDDCRRVQEREKARAKANAR